MSVGAAMLRTIAAMPTKAMRAMLLILADQEEAEERRLLDQRERTRRSRERNVTVTSQTSDTSRDTPSLSLSPTPPNSNPSPKENPLRGQKKGFRSEAFERFKASYPRRLGSNPWEPAWRKFETIVRDGVDSEAVIAGAKRYAAEQEKLGKVGSEFIAQAVTWLSQKCWQDYADDQFGDATDMVRKSDPRWQFLTARWERENSQPFPKLADKWPFPDSWLIDANKPEWPELPAFMARTA